MTSTAEAFISFAIVLASVSRTSGRSSTVTFKYFCNAGTLISNGIFSFFANSSGGNTKTLLNVTGTVARYLFVSNKLDKIITTTISVTFYWQVDLLEIVFVLPNCRYFLLKMERTIVAHIHKLSVRFIPLDTKSC